MKTAGIAVICKTPEPGKSKTRLSPPLSPIQCAALSECFIRDLGESVQRLCDERGSTAYALYTPLGSEEKLRRLLPDGFGLIAQCDGDLGARALRGMVDLLARGHDAAIILNADSPTLPMHLLETAIDRLFDTECVVLGPALDGGYTFIGLSHPHARLFEDIPWSTDAVHRLTLERAAEIGLPVVETAPWYDVDDARSLALLRADLAGEDLPFAAPRRPVVAATATRAFLATLG